jgi:hypothetical protein
MRAYPPLKVINLTTNLTEPATNLKRQGKRVFGFGLASLSSSSLITTTVQTEISTMTGQIGDMVLAETSKTAIARCQGFIWCGRGRLKPKSQGIYSSPNNPDLTREKPVHDGLFL